MNENFNNQANMENNNEQPEINSTENKKGGKTGLILIILVVLCLLGGGGYYIYTTSVNQNEKNNSNTTSTTTTESTTTESTTTESTTESTTSTTTSTTTTTKAIEKKTKIIDTYKTKNGKKVLKITELDSEGYYKGEYNGKKVELNEKTSQINKYLMVEGNFENEDGPCPTLSFIINVLTNELVDLPYDAENSYFKIVEKEGNYYFSQEACCGGSEYVYNEKLDKISDGLIIDGTKDYFFVLKDGYIAKLDKEGKTVKTGTLKVDTKNSGMYLDSPIIVNDNLYCLVRSNNKAYFYDFSNDKKYELDVKPEYVAVTTDTDRNDCGEIKESKNILNIAFKSEYNEDVDLPEYTFDIKTNKLTKK